MQVNLWGLDAIKTKGESVAVALHLVGARPVTEGTGRIARFELIPLSEMDGRPRVDVLCNMSGIFRDSFQNVVELMDDLFQKAAAAEEPEDLNFIRYPPPPPFPPSLPSPPPPSPPSHTYNTISSNINTLGRTEWALVLRAYPGLAAKENSVVQSSACDFIWHFAGSSSCNT